jgi:hypothetical protein
MGLVDKPKVTKIHKIPRKPQPEEIGSPGLKRINFMTIWIFYVIHTVKKSKARLKKLAIEKKGFIFVYICAAV